MPAPLTSLPCWYNLLTEGPIPCKANKVSHMNVKQHRMPANLGLPVKSFPLRHLRQSIVPVNHYVLRMESEQQLRSSEAYFRCIQDDIDVFSEVHTVILHDAQEESM